MAEVTAASHLKHTVVDGTLGVLLGGLIDHVFSLINTSSDGEDAKTTALLVFKIFGQMFVDVSLGHTITNALYPAGGNDDVTAGFTFMWLMYMASPNLRRDITGLSQLYQNWIHGYMDSMISDVHDTPK